jgi:transcriptional regulator with XRE-family HTH domain
MQTVVSVDRDKLLRLRLNAGLTQIELAEKAGVSPDTIVRWEGGRGKRPHPGSLGKISRALGVSPTDLLED